MYGIVVFGMLNLRFYCVLIVWCGMLWFIDVIGDMYWVSLWYLYVMW